MTTTDSPTRRAMLEREAVANTPKHWVRITTACNSRCIFCLDTDTPRDLYLSVEEIRRDIDHGRDALGAERLVLSGGEASLHPDFPALIRYALERGYERVQTVTNGWRYADRAFFRRVVEAGLGEITFSLHGHEAALHDRLTRHRGSFDRLIKGLVRALREPRLIVSVDVVINQQNVGVLDKIIELCLSLGVREFDLLHVIPQADAFTFRDQLFYDPREHLETLHKVFRLNRHPRVVVWTNRFPVAFLEGLEDLIQDPHKLIDELHGRRSMVRAYLDTGRPLDCRDPERCRHCFIEPLCTTIDRVIADAHGERWEVWWVGAEGWRGEPLPFGTRLLGLEPETLEDLDPTSLPAGVGLYLRPHGASPLDTLAPLADRELVVVADHPAQLDAWLAEGAPLPQIAVDITLNRQTAAWLLAHRDRLARVRRPLRLHQPSHETLAAAAAQDVRDPRAFFAALNRPLDHPLTWPLAVSGLPACLAPGARLVSERRILPRALFDRATGRPTLPALARYHVAQRYRAKSLRCAECALTERCEGIPINMVRDQGLSLAQPLTAGPATAEIVAQAVARGPLPSLTLATGRPPEPPMPSLPGCPPPADPPADPLAAVALRRDLARQARRQRHHRAATSDAAATKRQAATALSEPDPEEAP